MNAIEHETPRQPSAAERSCVECRRGPAPAPVPFLAPLIGLFAVVLCAPEGGWLLLAPYALDFRHGAAHVSRSTIVDLTTGAATIAVATATAVLFAMALVRRLRAASRAGLTSEPEHFPPESAPVSEPEPAARPAPDSADPGGALRDLLTPLVAALAADLRSHDHENDPRRQEP